VSRRLAWGAAALAIYALAVIVHARIAPAMRPLYDGLAPAAPYRYADPPPDLEAENELPEPGEGIVDIVGKGTAASSISTGDGQMQVVLPKGAFPARKGEKRVDVRIEPLAPEPPLEIGDGVVVEGNAYRVSAEYGKSGEPAALERPMTAVLRYPSFATVMVRRDGNAWRRLETQISQASLQLFADSEEIGEFATAGRPHTPGWRRWLPYAAGGAGVVAGVIGYLTGRRTRERRRRRGRMGRRHETKQRRRSRATDGGNVWRRLRGWLRR
jgi:hypothetical protein